MDRQPTFVDTMKGKIIIVFTLIIISLGVMWVVNRVAFEKITGIVQELSVPNEKLNISRKLFIDVSNLPHLQQTEVLKGKDKLSPAFINNTKSINTTLDSLRSFLNNEPNQLRRIDSIATLLSLDNKLFVDYLQLRYQIEQKKVFERQLSALSQKLDTPTLQVDSNVVTSERKVKTTTIIPPADTVEVEPQKASWLKRIFKKPQKEVVVVPQEPKVIVEEEVESRIDTVSVAQTDTSIAKLGTTLRKIENRRVQKLNQLVESEEELAKANNVLIHRLLTILNEIEKQEMEQVKKKTEWTVLLAGETINYTRLITILFIVIAMVFAGLILTDVTRSRRYRKLIEEAKAEAEYHSLSKQRFLANMSHEIRTPLQSIIGYSEQQLNNGNQNDENIRAIFNSSKHLLQIVNEVLDYSRITSGKFSFVNTVFSVKEVIAEVVSGLRLQAETKSLQLLVKEDLGATENVLGDSFRLKQVLFNLISNAIKFTEKGTVEVSVQAIRLDDKVELSFAVADTGIGMSEDELKRIFNQFEQVGNFAPQAQNGTGLGLSIVKELVEAQQGSITVESTPGKGSSFTVVIPFTYTEEIPAAQNAPANTKILGFKGKVWLVDDDELILRLSSIILTRYNIPHSCFTTAEDLLDEPWDDEVKMVFADMRLPGISGAELCTLLRRKVPTDTRIVALTAQVLPEEKAAILQSGFNQLLLKPFTEAELIGVLQQGFQPAVAKVGFNLNAVEKMVADPAEVNAVLKQCIEDTTSDMNELLFAVQANNSAKTSLIIHRLAGRTGQFGEKQLAKQLRRAEVAIRRENDVEGFEDEINNILIDLKAFLTALENEVETA